MFKDAFYTPKYLAEKLISFIPDKKYRSVVDFCIGDGELLRIAQKRWKKANFYGTDISEKTIKQVKLIHSDWNLGVCDFLNVNSRRRSHPLKANNEFDLIVLNPPFSCIGSTTFMCALDDIEFTCSRAMAFIVEAIKYISPSGCLFAILPNSVMYSQKDEKLLNYLIQQYDLELLEESDVLHFNNCSPHVVLISIKASVHSKIVTEEEVLNHSINNLVVCRGVVQMHSINPAEKKGNYLIHTTNLNNGKIEKLEFKHKSNFSQITGSAILLPRVGSPNINKVCFLKDSRTFILSDCVIAIKSPNEKSLLQLYSLIKKDCEHFIKIYKGTGAKYTTLKRLKRYLNIRND